MANTSCEPAVAQCVSFANCGRELDVFPSFCELILRPPVPTTQTALRSLGQAVRLWR
jgi:hypothetical protein